MVSFLFFYKLIRNPELKPDLDPRVKKCKIPFQFPLSLFFKDISLIVH